MDTTNYVARLNEFAQRKRWELKYEDVRSDGPDHIKTFTVRAVLNGKTYAGGVGRNKKAAKQSAAKNALDDLNHIGSESITTTQQTEDIPVSAPASPLQPAGITQQNYVCWLNEYGHKHRLSIKSLETTTLELTNATQCCSFVVGDKEYPPAYGKTKKEAKEEAAKLVYHMIFGSKTTESAESATPSQPKQDIDQNPSDITKNTQSITTEDEGFTDTNFIGILNHYCQKKNLLLDYVPVRRTGLPHIPQFFFKVVINKKEYPLAEGKNVKEAKQKAAQLAWATLQEQSDWDSKVSIHSSEDAPARFGTPPPTKQTSTSHSVVFSDAVSPSQNQCVETPDVKPKRRIAANFQNARRQSKEDIMPNLESKNENSPVKKAATQPISSRFVLEYDSIECLGKGAFGKVYKAKQKLIDKYFAIKIIRCKEKSLREVQALSDLNHVNIVRYHTCWMEDSEYQWNNSVDSCSTSQSTGSVSDVGFLYIQMELCDTKTLRIWIDERNTQNVRKSRRDPQRREESLKIMQEIITGVEYIHSKKLIHRDLKPANILFGRDTKVKIGDFGLVTSENNDTQNLVERTVYKGTPSYMAPEQKDRKTYDRKVDIFALGLIYFELLWNMGTVQERQTIWNELRAQKPPEGFTHKFPQENAIIKSMLCAQSLDRPEAGKVKTELEEWAQMLLTTVRTIHSV